MPKAIVLPVPVWARPRTSLPAIASGIALSWIGVGVVRPASLRAARRTGLRPRVSKSDKSYPLRPHGFSMRMGRAASSRQTRVSQDLKTSRERLAPSGTASGTLRDGELNSCIAGAPKMTGAASSRGCAAMGVTWGLKPGKSTDKAVQHGRGGDNVDQSDHNRQSVQHAKAALV